MDNEQLVLGQRVLMTKGRALGEENTTEIEVTITQILTTEDIKHGVLKSYTVMDDNRNMYSSSPLNLSPIPET